VLVGCAVVATTPPVAVAAHPSFTPGTACDAANCHNQYKHKEPFLGPCEKCHNLVDWKQVTFKHADADFDNGMHPLIGCTMCHTEGEPLPKAACSSCHDAKHKGWQSCSACHGTLAWGMRKPAPEGHVSLEGDHSELSCLDCHKAAKAPETARKCVTCHGTNHGGLTECQNCHDPKTGWEPKPGWSHNDFFVLRGAHTKLECGDCHEDGRFAGTPKVCVGCHGKKHGGLTDCGSCHSTSRFVPATFRHSSVFKLTGAHDDLKCSRCHPDRAFGRTISDGGTRCVSCHGAMHGGLTACADCHTTSRFTPSTFRHSDVFPLIGQHTTLLCTSCHEDGQFANVPGDDCVDCHADDSPHGPGVTDCADCHTPLISFAITTPFDDHPIPLGMDVDQHGTMACDLCHTTPVFTAPTTPCATCHSGDIPHVGPTDCLSCHWPTTWNDTHFTHPVILNFAQDNDSGHSSTEFGGYPNGCFQCHPGNTPDPDFTAASCLVAGCH